MKGYMIDVRGNRTELPPLFSWEIKHTDGGVSGTFEVCFRPFGDIYDTLHSCARFEAVYGGETVFSGVADDFELTEDAAGRYACVSGRTTAARLLDNEVRARQFDTCTLSEVLQYYVYPYGIELYAADRMNALKGYEVKSGSSAYGALRGFTYYSAGIIPRFLPDGRLVLTSSAGKTVRVTDAMASDVRYYETRYGVLSEVVLIKQGETDSKTVENTDFISRGGMCSRITVVPKYLGYDAAKYSPQNIIAESEDGTENCELTLEKPFFVQPSDILELELKELGIHGAFTVTEACSFASASGCGTRVKAKRRMKW